MASRFIEALDKASIGLTLGWAIGGGCQAGGKFYTNQTKTTIQNQWLSRCVTPGFERKLAIGLGTAFFFAPLTWDVARERFKISQKKCDAIAIGVAAGALVLTTRYTSEKAYQVIKVMNICYAALRLTYEGLSRLAQPRTSITINVDYTRNNYY